MQLNIEHLTRAHNRREFDCGDVELNRYLRNTARQHSEKGISRTFVLISDDSSSQILGYFTLVFCEIIVEKLPKPFAKKYPPRAPAAKLARLAVGKQIQKQGLGTYMVLNALDRILQVAEHLGIIGFFVDAKDDEAARYYHQFGFMPLPDSHLELFLPMETIRRAFGT